VDAATVLPAADGAWAGAPQPLMERDAYLAALERLHGHILAGDIYQANFTFPAQVPFAGDPLALYAGLRERAQAGHGALIFTGTHWILSLSPELFFTKEGRQVTTRPMKGTATRGTGAAEDAERIAALAADPKQRAENLMIVDLLRNDLSRVSAPGTVKVPELFQVETYPTVHQLVSTVTGELEPGRDAVDVLHALFPCGSITGAPKIRAMEIIAGTRRPARASIAARSAGSMRTATRRSTWRSARYRCGRRERRPPRPRLRASWRIAGQPMSGANAWPRGAFVASPSAST
jgi:para-aminobenzoate synthetase/4-amino-4-deoxychorismate lyase